MLFCTRALFRIPIKQPLKIFPNQSSNIYLEKLRNIQQQQLTVETERTSLFRCLLTYTAVKLEGLSNAVIKRKRSKSFTSIKLLASGFQFLANLVVITDSYKVLKLSQVYPIVHNLIKLQSGTKLIDKTNMGPAENFTNEQVTTCGSRLLFKYPFRQLNSATSLEVMHWLVQRSKPTDIGKLQNNLVEALKHLLTKSSSRSTTIPFTKCEYLNNLEIYDIIIGAERISQKLEILRNKFRDIKRRLLVTLDENLQLFYKVESIVPAAKAYAFKSGHNVNNHLLTSRSASVLLKMNTVMSRINTGLSAGRNFSNKSGTFPNLDIYSVVCFFIKIISQVCRRPLNY